MDNIFSRPMTVGIYTPSESFRSAPEHVAVMFIDNNGLVAVTGYADDAQNLKESYQYARLFAESPKLLKALQEIAYGQFGKSAAVKRIAKEAIEGLEIGI